MTEHIDPLTPPRKPHADPIVDRDAYYRALHPFFLSDAVALARRAAQQAGISWDNATDAQRLRYYLDVLTPRSRKLAVVLGDYSDDGHGKTETLVVEAGGEDVSDTALRASYARAVESAGFSPYDILNDYEAYAIDIDSWEKLDAVWTEGARARDALAGTWVPGPEFTYTDDADQEGTAPMLSLVMAFVGFGIRDFRWSPLSNTPPVVMGGWEPLLGKDTGSTMLGYGLYQ